jgi:tRNA pseudouridine32 synthase / 23S rRNA pseudouridine746 synthase
VNSERTRPGIATLVLPDGPWVFLIDYLTLRFKSLTRQEILRRMALGEIADVERQHSHDVSLGPDEPYRAHRRLHYLRQVNDEVPVPFEETIVFQDELILVADKPPFLTVVPAGRHLDETLLVRLRLRTGLDHLVPMHRIDRETSGLVMFTKEQSRRGAYQSMFEAKAIHKTYEAIAPDLTQVQFPLRHASYIRESPAFMQMEEVAGREPNSATRIERLDGAGGLARYRVTPETGKKHQIRIHFSALGMPILNDRIYPVLQAENTDDYQRPLQLLAKALRFKDPITGEERFFESPRQLMMLPT